MREKGPWISWGVDIPAGIDLNNEEVLSEILGRALDGTVKCRAWRDDRGLHIEFGEEETDAETL
jgi:hypothetical protein